jgi:hypothetical protein
MPRKSGDDARPLRPTASDDQHQRDDDHFESLIAGASSNDTKLLLRGMQHLCVLLVELQIGQNPKTWN